MSRFAAGALGAMASSGFSYTNFESADWTLEGSGDTFGSGTITTTSNNAGAYSGGVTLSGDFSAKYTIAASGAIRSAGVFPVSEVGTFVGTHGSGRGLMDTMTNSCFWHGNTGHTHGIYHGSSVAVVSVPANSAEIRWERIGSVISVYENDVLQHAFSGASTADMYFAYAHDNATNASYSGVQYLA